MSARRIEFLVAAAIALGAGLLAAAGAGPAAAGHAGTATEGTGATAPTVSTMTMPTVTTVTAPTPPSSQMPGYHRPVIVLGDMNTPEQFILGQLYQLALENAGFSVELTRNIGPPWVAQDALKQGTLDLYPQYLGQWNSYVAHLHRRFRSLSASYAAGAAYALRHRLVLLAPTPFSDTSGIAVSAQYAEENRVRSLPSLARGPAVTIGVPLEFRTISDGLPAIVRAYHLHPGYVQSIDVGLQYWWLNTGDVQAVYSSTTDPQLAGPGFVELSDPKHVFGFGNVVPVTTSHVLKVEGPVFRAVIDRVDSLLTLEAMRGLNREYVIAGHDATTIAQEFLEGSGVLPPSRFAPVSTRTTTTSDETATSPPAGVG